MLPASKGVTDDLCKSRRKNPRRLPRRPQGASLCRDTHGHDGLDPVRSPGDLLRPPRLIATCRPGKHQADVCRTLLLEAIGAGAAYVDVEVHWPAPLREEIVAAAKAAGCAVIASYHNFEETPGRATLEKLVSDCFGTGADYCQDRLHGQK